MASPNTLRLQAEREVLRKGGVKITEPLLLYGANRKTRRTQLRQVYKEGFLSYEEAKRAIRLQDQEKLEKYRSFAQFLTAKTKQLQAEYAARGEELTEEQAFALIKKEAHEANLAEQKRLAQDAREEVDADRETSA